MRDIKFRVFEKSNGRMKNVNEITWHQGKILFYEDSDEYSKLMQYTGLKDKNGKGEECFAGDICKYFNRTGVIRQINGGFDFYSKYDKVSINLTNKDFQKEFKILGDTYQNPELLFK